MFNVTEIEDMKSKYKIKKGKKVIIVNHAN